VLIPLPKDTSELVFEDGSDGPIPAYLGTVWDNERPASSDFILLKIKKSAWVISSKQGIADHLDALAAI
jgi:hypothetical protein